jgi:hypothetical protein
MDQELAFQRGQILSWWNKCSATVGKFVAGTLSGAAIHG